MVEPEPLPRGNGHERKAPPKPPLRARARRWRREHPLGFVALVMLALVVVAAALLIWWWLHTHETTDDAQIDGHIAAMSSRIAGTVTAVFVEDNVPVTRGQLLVQLDPRDQQVALDRAQAELAQARALYEAERANLPITTVGSATSVATSADEVVNARAALAAAEADDARAQAELARARYLIGERAIAKERYDQVVAAATASRKLVDEARARLQQARSRRGEARTSAPERLRAEKAQLDARAAAVAAAEAAAERARLDLEYTRIVAPVDGIVGKRSVEPGQRVQPGEQLLAVVGLDDLWVTANFKETQLRRLAVGQKVRIKVDALATTLDGTVESFAGASGARYSLLPPENATGNYVKVVQRLPVRIRLAPGQDRQRRLRPGMSVEPRVSLR